MLVAIALCLAGLVILIVGAKYFIDGIALIAEAFGVPPLIIGMTLVAFGTSTPELVVNALSAQRGETSLAFGNIVGSCTVNIGLVLAITALVKPVKVESIIITREIPMLILSVAALGVLGFDTALNGTGPDAFARTDGLILLLLFGVLSTTQSSTLLRRNYCVLASRMRLSRKCLRSGLLFSNGPSSR